ncbi:MAG: hypothetical protein AB8H79_03700 [Myxococcota bacterium]
MLLHVLWTAAFAGPFELTDETYFIDEPVVVTSGPSTWRLTEGYLFPIRDDAGPAGFTFVGEGTWEVSFQDNHQAQQTANQLAMFAGGDVEALAPVASREAPLSLAVDVGVWIAADASSWLDQAVRVRKSRRGLTILEDDGTETVIVVQHRNQGPARALAKRQLDVRQRWMQQRWRDPSALLELDRRFDHTEASVIADFRTDVSWDRFIGMPGATANRAPNHWLGAVYDPRGLFDASTSHQVVARTTGERRRAEEQTLSAQAFPHLANHQPRPRVRPVLKGMNVRVTMDLVEGNGVAQTSFEAKFSAEASEGTVDHLVVSLPHSERTRWYSDPPLAESWVLSDVRDSRGRPLPAIPLAITGDETEGRGSRRTFVIDLKRPLKPGEPQTFTLAWSEKVRYRRQLVTECCLYDLGATTGLLPAAPRLHPTPAKPVPLRLIAGTSAQTRHKLVSSGASVETYRDSGRRWLHTQSSLVEPRIALGRWKTFAAPAVGRLPQIQMDMRTLDGRSARKLGITLRQMLNFYDPLLPDYPTRQIRLMEGGSSMESISFVSADNIVSFNPIFHFTEGLDQVEAAMRIQYPNLETFMLGTAVATAYFAKTETASQDPKIIMVLPRVYAMYLMKVAHGQDIEQIWIDNIADKARHHRQASVGRPWSEEGYSTRLLALYGLFRHHHGDRALLAAMDHLASGREPASMAGLVRALERESGTSQQRFVDAWLRAGLAPKLDLNWHWEANTVTVQITGDVPFGEYDVPVLVDDTETWVRLKNGRGVLRLPLLDAPTQVGVHPSFPAPSVRVRKATGATPTSFSGR